MNEVSAPVPEIEQAARYLLRGSEGTKMALESVFENRPIVSTVTQLFANSCVDALVPFTFLSSFCQCQGRVKVLYNHTHIGTGCKCSSVFAIRSDP